nr:hypothetical protein I308_03525 [Cryptococcus tetragattii IND107]
MTTRYALRVRYIPAKSSSKKNLFCSRPEAGSACGPSGLETWRDIWA